MTIIALVLTIILGTGSLFYGFYEQGMVEAAHWVLVLGGVWLVSQWFRWNWFSSLALFASIVFAAIGLWVSAFFGWMAAGAVFALFAWDMSDFRQRMRFISQDDDARGMERRHIARLSLLTLLGLIFLSIASVLQFKFTFEWGVFLVIVILIGLAQLVGWFKKQ